MSDLFDSNLKKEEIELIEGNENINEYFKKLKNENLVLVSKIEEFENKSQQELKSGLVESVKNEEEAIDSASISGNYSRSNLDDSLHCMDKRNVEKLTYENTKLKSAVLILKQKIKKIQEKSLKKTSYIEEIEKKLNSLSTETDEYSKSFRDFSQILSEISTDVSGNVNEVKDPIGMWKNTLTTNKALSEQNRALINDMKLLEDKIQSLENDNDGFKTAIKNIKDENSELLSALNNSKEENQHQIQIIDGLKIEIKQQERIKIKLAKVIKKMSKKIPALSENKLASENSQKSKIPIKFITEDVLKKYHESLIEILPTCYSKQIGILCQYLPTSFTDKAKEFDFANFVYITKRLYHKVFLLKKTLERSFFEGILGRLNIDPIGLESLHSFLQYFEMLTTMGSIYLRLKACKRLAMSAEENIIQFLANLSQNMSDIEIEFDKYSVIVCTTHSKSFAGVDMAKSLLNKINELISLYYKEDVIRKAIPEVDLLEDFSFNTDIILGVNRLLSSVSQMEHFNFMACIVAKIEEVTNTVRTASIKISRGVKKTKESFVVFPPEACAIICKSHKILSRLTFLLVEHIKLLLLDSSFSLECPDALNEESSLFTSIVDTVQSLLTFSNNLSNISNEIHKGSFDKRKADVSKPHSLKNSIHEFKTRVFVDYKMIENLKSEIAKNSGEILNCREAIKERDIKIYQLELVVSNNKVETQRLQKEASELSKSLLEKDEQHLININTSKKREEMLKDELSRMKQSHHGLKAISIYNDLMPMSQIDTSNLKDLRKLLTYERVSLHSLIDKLHKENCHLKASGVRKQAESLDFSHLKVRTLSNTIKLEKSSADFITESTLFMDRLYKSVEEVKDSATLHNLISLLNNEKVTIDLKFTNLENDYLKSFEHLPCKNLFKYFPYIKRTDGNILSLR